MKPTIFLFNIFTWLLFLVLPCISFAQYTPEWAKGFGGDRQDRARASLETPDGNYIITGEVSRRRTNMWLLKLSSDGNEIWGTVFEDSHFSKANAIAYSPDGYIITAGEYIQSRRNRDINAFIMKSTGAGEPVWLKEYGDILTDRLNDLIVSSENEYIAVGFSEGGEDFTQKRLWFLRTDAEGKVLSEKFYADTEEDVAHAITETDNGNFLIVGYSITGETKTRRIMKVDKEGEALWDLPLLYGNINEAHDVIELDDGFIYVCGTYRVQPLTDYDDMLVKVSPDGEEVFMKTYGNSNWEEATSITVTHDGLLVLAGFEKTEDEMTADFKIRLIDTEGNETFLHTFIKRSLDYAEQVIETQDKGLLVIGSTHFQESGWDYAALKYRNVNRTDIEIRIPDRKVITVASPVFKIKVCMNSFAPPVKSSISLNNEMLYTDIYNEFAVAETACLYPVYADILLHNGLNTIKVFMEDLHGFSVKDSVEIFYIPEDDLNW